MRVIPRGQPTWPVLGTWLLVAAAGGISLWWRLAVGTLERKIERKQSDLKRLHLGGRLPPNREVLDYLKDRTSAVEAQYHTALAYVAPMPAVVEGQSDLQLHFQQRVHEVQRTLERLATARGMTVPSQLGIPKELPPTDAVPRFLTQLSLIEETAEFLLRIPEISQVVSFKIEDPQALGAAGDAEDSFLTKLPVRVHLSCSLEALTKILGRLDRTKPLIDLQSLSVAIPGTTQSPASSLAQDSKALEMEFVLVRYFVTAPSLDQPEEESPKASPGEKSKKPS